MKPWTERKQVAEAMGNTAVAIGARALPTGIALRGLYAARDFAPGDYVASYQGRTIHKAELMALHESDRAAYDRVTEYAVGSLKEGMLFPNDLDAPGAHLINHSCQPNTDWAQKERGAMLIRAIRPIKEGEELTIFYGWLGLKDAIDGPRHPCACQAPFCAGSVPLYVEMVDFGDGRGGPRLPEEEVERRFLADLYNDTNEHEGLLHRYATEGIDMIMGVERVAPFDFDAYREKLEYGASQAVLRAMREGRNVSGRRFRQIVHTYAPGVAVSP